MPFSSLLFMAVVYFRNVKPEAKRFRFLRATDGARTRDPDLGKVVLYQLSHCRISCVLCSSEQ